MCSDLHQVDCTSHFHFYIFAYEIRHISLEIRHISPPAAATDSLVQYLTLASTAVGGAAAQLTDFEMQYVLYYSYSFRLG